MLCLGLGTTTIWLGLGKHHDLAWNTCFGHHKPAWDRSDFLWLELSFWWQKQMDVVQLPLKKKKKSQLWSPQKQLETSTQTWTAVASLAASWLELMSTPSPPQSCDKHAVWSLYATCGTTVNPGCIRGLQNNNLQHYILVILGCSGHFSVKSLSWSFTELYFYILVLSLLTVFAGRDTDQRYFILSNNSCASCGLLLRISLTFYHLSPRIPCTEKIRPDQLFWVQFVNTETFFQKVWLKHLFFLYVPLVQAWLYWHSKCGYAMRLFVWASQNSCVRKISSWVWVEHMHLHFLGVFLLYFLEFANQSNGCNLHFKWGDSFHRLEKQREPFVKFLAANDWDKNKPICNLGWLTVSISLLRNM